MPAMIIAANLPDIDSFIAGAIGCEPIAVHRGFTHGPLGVALMAVLAAAIIWCWERLRPGKEGPLRLGGLLIACYLAALSHPLLDLMNTYGTRVLDPLSDRWFYADTLFIIDPWIWIMLILGLEMSWRAERSGKRLAAPGGMGIHRDAALHRSQRRDIGASRCTDPTARRTRGTAAHDRCRRGPAHLLET